MILLKATERKYVADDVIIHMSLVAITYRFKRVPSFRCFFTSVSVDYRRVVVVFVFVGGVLPTFFHWSYHNTHAYFLASTFFHFVR